MRKQSQPNPNTQDCGVQPGTVIGVLISLPDGRTALCTALDRTSPTYWTERKRALRGDPAYVTAPYGGTRVGYYKIVRVW